ncbi:MAG: signal peptidase I [Pseudomonadota bacterium]
MATDKAADQDDKPRDFRAFVKKELREWGATLSVFIPLFFLFSTFAYELRVIPSESMVPNLQVGDRVTVNKFAYGYSRHSLPFSLGRYVPLPEGRIFASEPERGDVVVFEHPHTSRVMIKRLIGVPGDEIRLRNGQIYLDGRPIGREFERSIRYTTHSKNRTDRRRVEAGEWRETVGDKSWLTHDINDADGTPNTPLFRVPEGHYLFMGDNRDNSADGRAQSGHCLPDENNVISEAGCPRSEDATVGFVPFQNLIGRADTVLFTTYRCSKNDAQPCMKKRLWRGL